MNSAKLETKVQEIGIFAIVKNHLDRAGFVPDKKSVIDMAADGQAIGCIDGKSVKVTLDNLLGDTSLIISYNGSDDPMHETMVLADGIYVNGWTDDLYRGLREAYLSI